MRVRTSFLSAALVAAACAPDSPNPPLAPSEPLRIVSGSPDNGAHPYVGLLVFDDASGPVWACSGALLSSTVVLTAGHCTDGAVAARIWMDESLVTNVEYPFSGATSYDGTPHTFPGYCIGCVGIGILDWLSGDVGIVVLSEAVPVGVVGSYVQLPSAGQADLVAKKAVLELTGYGVQHKLVGGGPPTWSGTLARFATRGQFVSGDFYNSGQLMRITANPGKGKGGMCFGDSGGPDLVAGSTTVLAVNSFVTSDNCSGVTYSMRVDTPAILNWIGGFLP
jgi:hypothetical protein